MPETARKALAVRCVTLNLLGLKQDWFDKRQQAVIAGLKPLAPDVVFFQEATIRGHGKIYNQAAEIGLALGLENVAFAPYGNPIEVMSHDQGGVAIAARWPIRYAENRRLPEGEKKPTDNRVALFLTLHAPGGPLHVVTTHLSWRPEEASMRLVQMGILLDYFEHAGLCAPGVRMVLAGDLNAGDFESAVELVQDRFQDTFRALHPEAPGYTWNNTNPLTQNYPLPDRRLDYIFCPQDAQVRASRLILDRPDPVFASDHFGLYAEIYFPPAIARAA